MRKSALRAVPAVLLLLILLPDAPAQEELVEPFECPATLAPPTSLDKPVVLLLKERGIEPSPACSDVVFLRRVYLDVIGTLPEPRQVTSFLRSNSLQKRSVLIDYLLDRREFVDYWTLKWCDTLRVKAEFPINLWPNAVQAYYRWLHDAVRENKPYDQMAREMLTSSGSNFRVPAVNFYRAVQGREPTSIAAVVALTFMGSRIETWPEERRKGMEAIFSRISFKGTAEWKEEIVGFNPAHSEPLQAVFPDGSVVVIEASEDPRQVFAEWLIRPDNPWFTRNIVNRIWYWIFGRGIIHEADDIRDDNPPVNPALLHFLETEMIESGYDMKHIFRLILNSRTYQRSPVPRCEPGEGAIYFAHYPVRRLDAEVLIDALCWISGTKESYSSPIPEPFTFIPEEHRTISLTDGSITSQFLEMFGRPPRDTGQISERNNRPSGSQSLHLLNSSHIQQKIERSWRLRNIYKKAKGKPRAVIDTLYLHILSRHPTGEEVIKALQYFGESGLDREKSAIDLAWVLINSKEFLYRH